MELTRLPPYHVGALFETGPFAMRFDAATDPVSILSHIDCGYTR